MCLTAVLCCVLPIATGELERFPVGAIRVLRSNAASPTRSCRGVKGAALLPHWLAQPVAGGPFVPVRVELTFGSEVAVFEALSIR